jgi:hypothetical protein
MQTAFDILNKLARVDVLLSAQAAIEDTASDATAAQRSQLAQGLKADDTFQPDYSPRSVSVYGKEPGPIKLKDTGAYYAGLAIDVQGDKFSIFSTDIKNDYLEGKYHPLGLGTDARVKYILTLKPVLIKHIHDYLK